MSWIIDIFKNCITINSYGENVKQHYVEIRQGWHATVDKIDSQILVRIVNDNDDKLKITVCMIPENITSVFWNELQDVYISMEKQNYK